MTRSSWLENLDPNFRRQKNKTHSSGLQKQKRGLKWLHRLIIHRVSRPAFVLLFTTRPFKLITYNKRWWNSALLLSSLLKFLFLFLNYKCPNKWDFCSLHDFIWDFLEYPPVTSFKIFTVRVMGSCNSTTNPSWYVLWTGTKRVYIVLFSIFATLCLLPLQNKWSDRFLWKPSFNYSKTFITTSLPNFMEFHPRKHEKIHCQFCFLPSCCREKISKNTDVFL